VAAPVVSAGSDLVAVGALSRCFRTARVGAFVGKLEYPMYHPVPREDTGPHDAGAKCYQRGKVCKSRRGLTLHQRTCLARPDSGSRHRLSNARTPATSGMSRKASGSRDELSKAQTPTTGVAHTCLACEGDESGGSVSASASSISSGLRDGLSHVQTPATIVGCHSADALECRDVVGSATSGPPENEVSNANLRVESNGVDTAMVFLRMLLAPKSVGPKSVAGRVACQPGGGDSGVGRCLSQGFVRSMFCF